jgi:hypothetical protein
MTDSWPRDLCDRHFTGTMNRIQPMRKIRNAPNKYEYVSYQQICSDCEPIDKIMSENARRRKGP